MTDQPKESAIEHVFSSNNIGEYQSRNWWLMIAEARAELAAKDAKLAELEGIDQACDAANSHVLELEKELAELRAKEPLCVDCGKPESDSGMHFTAPGTNWGAALHHYRPATAVDVEKLAKELSDVPFHINIMTGSVKIDPSKFVPILIKALGAEK